MRWFLLAGVLAAITASVAGAQDPKPAPQTAHEVLSQIVAVEDRLARTIPELNKLELVVVALDAEKESWDAMERDLKKQLEAIETLRAATGKKQDEMQAKVKKEQQRAEGAIQERRKLDAKVRIASSSGTKSPEPNAPSKSSKSNSRLSTSETQRSGPKAAPELPGCFLSPDS
jgi:hypothetical protein